MKKFFLSIRGLLSLALCCVMLSGCASSGYKPPRTSKPSSSLFAEPKTRLLASSTQQFGKTNATEETSTKESWSDRRKRKLAEKETKKARKDAEAKAKRDAERARREADRKAQRDTQRSTKSSKKENHQGKYDEKGRAVTTPLPTYLASSADSPERVYRLKPGDPVLVTLRGIPKEREIADVIDESGYINMTFIGRLEAAGKTSTELEQLIEKSYLEKQIYKYVTVNVVIPSKSYYVRGEVLKPGRFSLAGGVSLLQAIASAGGYNQFANPKKIKILRGDRTITINMKTIEKHPEKDLPLLAGDVIVIPRSVF